MRARAIAAAVVAIVAVAGCGEDKPTKAEYIAQVDRICKRAKPAERRLSREFAGIRQAGGARAKRRRLQSTLDEAVRTETDILNEVKAVERPEGAAGEQAQRFIRSNEQDIAILRRLSSALKQNSAPAFTQALQQISARRGTTKGIAQGYGFKVCGSG
ncbi:MAG: hypothetical protein M3N16_06605 [Actinomycetota bacterium]|nr:hypothetical protein [Actinomycetota bacterium]